LYCTQHLQNDCHSPVAFWHAALEGTKFVFGRGSAPNPTGGAYSAPPDRLAGLRGPTSNGERRERRGKRERRREEERNGRDRPPFRKFRNPPLWGRGA